MKNIAVILIIFFCFISNSYSQLDDILKKIPGVGDVFEEAVSTNIKDAYPSALWLKGLDKQIPVTTGESYSTGLPPGYYKFDFKTFCLHAGGYAPTEGSGYLAAPLMGTRAKLIQSILTRYDDNQNIEQRDVQLLIWGVEAGQKFSNYPADFQLRVTPLLTPDEIAQMEVDLKEIALDLLPGEAKEILNLYHELRSKLSDVNTSYEQIEQIAVKTGIPPPGKGSKNIERGTWSSIGNGVYIRSFTDVYPKSQVEIYMPEDVTIQYDQPEAPRKIISLDDGSYRIELQYEPNSSKFKSALLKNTSTNEEINISNTITDDASVKSQTDEFLSLVRKSFGKKKSRGLKEESRKTIVQLKTIELVLSSLVDKTNWQGNAYITCVNALNGYLSEIESGKIKGGSERLEGFDIHGIVFAPGNTAVQREGNGGNGNKDKDKCKPEVIINPLSQDYLPEPGISIDISLDIKNLGEKCSVEEIHYELKDVSRELGRCINDKTPDLYDTRLDFYIYPGYYVISSQDSLSGDGNGQATTVRIGCNDFGAYGKLTAKVKINGIWYNAKDAVSKKDYITLPYDYNENRIADKWETQNKVMGLPATWDEDPEPAGQKTSGDGLTNYEEYRGCWVHDEFVGVKHIRTNPRKKEIFIIDAGNIFVSVSWEKATEITAYYLTYDLISADIGGASEEQPEFRRVNFCSNNAKGEKYAVNLIKVKGLKDPYGKENKLTVWGYSPLGPPKYVERTVIFPDRRWEYTKFVADSLYTVLKNNPSQNTFYFDGDAFLRSEIEKFLNVCKDNQKFELLIEFLVNRTVIHEVGHACGVNHHTNIGGGNIDCPMRYINNGDVLNFSQTLKDLFDIVDTGVYVIAIYTNWKFCKSADNCWGQLNVNDRY